VTVKELMDELRSELQAALNDAPLGAPA
jgi:hypothetical protein